MSFLINPYSSFAAAAPDLYFANVVLLCHFDGANGATTTTDSSSAAHALTFSGSAALTTAQFKYGAASLSNVSTSWVSTPDSADWNFAAGTFTVEAFVRPILAISGIVSIVAQFGASSNLGWFFGFNGNTLNFFYSTTGANNPAVTGNYTPTSNTWIHIAADRDASNVLRVYVDGAVLASATVAATFFDSTRSLRIGNDENNTRGFTGQIDEVRITKGVARYGGAFTPPGSAFPNS